jgi:hypothetical protein
MSRSFERADLTKSMTYLRKSDKIFKLLDLQKNAILRDLEVGHFKV